MAETLEQVLADMRGDAAVLRRHGDERVAVSLERFATRAAAAADEFLTFIPETDAQLRSGHAVSWLRALYRELEPGGHAVTRSGVRYYRALLVPRRVDRAALRARAQRLARGAA